MATHTPVFLPREFHGQRSLVGYRPWGHKESDTAEQLTHTQDSQGAQCKRPSHLAGLGCGEVVTSVGQRLWVSVKPHRLEWVPPGVCTGQGSPHLGDGEEGQRPGPFPPLTWC